MEETFESEDQKKLRVESPRFRRLTSETIMEYLEIINRDPCWNDGNIHKCQERAREENCSEGRTLILMENEDEGLIERPQLPKTL